MRLLTKKATDRVAALLCAALFPLLFLALLAVPASAAPEAWDGTVATAFAGGDGSAESPYLISDASQLAYFASTVVRSSKPVTYEGQYIKLTEDIVLNILPANPIALDIKEGIKLWTPIGSLSRPFKGSFDGDGHTVFGLCVNGTLESVGLFGCAENAVVRNVNIENAYIFSYGHNAALIGLYRANGTSDGYTVNNCRVKNSTVHNNQAAFGRTGGVFGGVTAQGATVNISGCTAEGVSVTGYSSEIGGIVGIVDATSGSIVNVSGCRSDGSVSCFAKAASSIGGAFGVLNASGSRLTVTLCASDADLTGKGKMIGGFAGSIRADDKGTVEVVRCYSSGSVIGDDGATERLGAFAGQLSSENYESVARLSDCFATGNVVNDGEYTGGIVGCLYAQLSTSEVIRCYYAGIITGASKRGAVIGGAYVPPRSTPATVALVNCSYYFLSAETAYGGVSGVDSSKLKGSLPGTTVDLSKATNYTDYDFDAVWEMKPNAAYRFPTIRNLEYRGEYAHRSEYKITVRHTDTDGNELLPATESMLETGGKYKINPGNVVKFTASPSGFSGVMGEEPLEFTFVYKQTEFPPHKLSISYLLESGDAAAPAYSGSVNEYSGYSIKSPLVTGYTADKPEVSGTMGIDDVSESVTYRINSHTLRILYLMPDGKYAADSYATTLDYGVRYEIASPSVTGYLPSLNTVSGHMPDSDVTVTVKYQTIKVTLEIEYIYSDDSGAAPIYGGRFDYGYDYSITSPHIEGFVSSPAIVSGTLTSDLSITVIYTRIPKIQILPATPQAETLGTETLRIKPITPPENAEILYGITAENDPSKISEWVSGIDFAGLTPGGNYYVFARIPENLYYVEGVSGGLAVTMKRLDRTLSVGEAVDIVTDGFKVSGYTAASVGDSHGGAADDGIVEYGVSKVSTPESVGIWQTSDVFAGLEDATEYFFFVRITGSDRYADITSEAKRITTDKIPETTKAPITTATPETTEAATVTDEPTAPDITGNDTQDITSPIPGGDGCKGRIWIQLLVCSVAAALCATVLYLTLRKKR